MLDHARAFPRARVHVSHRLTLVCEGVHGQ